MFEVRSSASVLSIGARMFDVSCLHCVSELLAQYVPGSQIGPGRSTFFIVCKSESL